MAIDLWNMFHYHRTCSITIDTIDPIACAFFSISAGNNCCGVFDFASVQKLLTVASSPILGHLGHLGPAGMGVSNLINLKFEHVDGDLSSAY